MIDNKAYLNSIKVDFFKTPNRIFEFRKRYKISFSTAWVFLYLAAQKNNFWNPGERKIAKDLGCSTSTVTKAIKELRRGGVIEVVAPKQKGQRNKYILKELSQISGQLGVPKNSTHTRLRDGKKRKDFTRGAGVVPSSGTNPFPPLTPLAKKPPAPAKRNPSSTNPDAERIREVIARANERKTIVDDSCWEFEKVKVGQ